MSDLAFEKLLAASQEDFANAEEFGNDWMPDDGVYTVSVTKLAKGVTAKGDKPIGWWKLTGLIEDVDDANHGKEFCIGFFRTSVLGILKGACRVLNGGDPIEDIALADELLEASVGEILKVKVATKPGKDGRDYTNCYLQEVMATEDEEAEDVVEAPEEPTEPAEATPDGNVVADMPEGDASADIEDAAGKNRVAKAVDKASNQKKK